MKKINFLFIAALLISITSCSKLYELNQPKEPVVEHSSIWPLSGEWYVTYEFEHPNGTSGLGDWYGVGHTKLFTYNTADESKTNFWISDEGNFWTYKVKSSCNVDSKTFASTDSLDNYSGDKIKINIKKGQVFIDGGKSPSGVVTDSIYFEIEYADDPGTIYHVAGIRRTGFIEDEY